MWLDMSLSLPEQGDSAPETTILAFGSNLLPL